MKVVVEQRVETRESKKSKGFFFDPFLNFIKPSAYVDGVSNIDISSLKSQGVKLLVCDLDNTLVPHYTKFPNKTAFDFVEKVMEEGIIFVLISNNTSKRVSFFADKLNVDHYISGAKKPLVKRIKAKLSELNVTADETIFVGDMIVMDMLVANRLKSDSILVKPLMDADKSFTRVIDFFEKYIFKRLDKKNLLVSKMKIEKDLYEGKYEEL